MYYIVDVNWYDFQREYKYKFSLIHYCVIHIGYLLDITIRIRAYSMMQSLPAHTSRSKQTHTRRAILNYKILIDVNQNDCHACAYTHYCSAKLGSYINPVRVPEGGRRLNKYIGLYI